MIIKLITKKQMIIKKAKLYDKITETLYASMNYKNKWYKNCRNARKRKCKICQDCPTKKLIEKLELPLTGCYRTKDEYAKRNK